LKVLSAALTLDESARYRFSCEADHRLVHPAIVPVIANGEQDGRPFHVLPYYPGGSLDRWVSSVWRGGEESQFARIPSPSDPDFFLKAAQWVAEVARGVSFAHEQGLIHRDLKPSNILLDSEGNPSIADFGASRRITVSERLSNTGVVCGSPEYLPPEVASGQVTGGTMASDIYGIGAILFEMLSGHAPYSGPNVMATLQRIAVGPDPVLRNRNANVPRDLALICQTCLARDPTLRYRSALDVAEDLERFSREEPVLVLPRSAWMQLRLWAVRNRLAAAFALACVAILMVAFGITSIEWRRASRAAEDQRRQVVSQWIHQGIEAVREGNALSSLPWLVAAWRSDANQGASPERIRLHQRRFLDAARKLPHLEQVRAVPFAVKVLATSQDGRWVAAAGSDPRDGIMVWGNTGSSELVRHFPAAETVVQLSFTHPDNYLVIQSMNSHQEFSVALLEIETGHRRFRVPMPDRINTVEASPDGHCLAVGCRDGSLRVVGALDGGTVAEFQHQGQVRRLAWISPDRILSVGYDNWARIWEPRTGRVVSSWDAGEYLREAVVSRSGGWLAFGGDHCRATVVDLTSLAVRFEVTHPGWVTAMAVSKSGKLLATGDRLGNIRVWDAISGRPLIEWLSTEGLEVRRLAFSLDDRILGGLCSDRTLRNWSVSDGRILGSSLPMEAEPQPMGWLTSNRVVTVTPRGSSPVWAMEGLTLGVDPHPLRASLQQAITSDSGRWIALHLGDKGVYLEDAHRPGVAPSEVTAAPDILNMAFQPGTSRLLIHGKTPKLEVWDVASEKSLKLRIPTPAPLAAIRFSPSGRWLACGSQLGHLQIRRVELSDGAGDLPVTFETQIPIFGEIRVQLRWSPDERFLYFGLASSHWVVARAEDQASLFRLELSSGKITPHGGLGISEVMAMELSPTGRWLAVSGVAGKVRLIRMDPRFELGPLISPPKITSSLQFERDRERLWTGGYDQTIRVWDVPTGQLLRSDIRLAGTIRNIALTQDGTMMLAGAESGQVGIWDPKTLEPVCVRPGPVQSIRFCGFSADSRWAMYGGSDRRIHRISLEDEVIAFGEAQLMVRALAPFEIDEAGLRIDLSSDESHAAWSRWRQTRRPALGSN
jgi:WD40 repeat protein